MIERQDYVFVRKDWKVFTLWSMEEAEDRGLPVDGNCGEDMVLFGPVVAWDLGRDREGIIAVRTTLNDPPRAQLLLGSGDGTVEHIIDYAPGDGFDDLLPRLGARHASDD